MSEFCQDCGTRPWACQLMSPLGAIELCVHCGHDALMSRDGPEAFEPVPNPGMRKRLPGDGKVWTRIVRKVHGCKSTG
jgi:hypothetical protein